MKEPTVPFVDAQAMAAAHPTTYKVPNVTELQQIGEGDFVKVCAANERFWCRVDHRITLDDAMFFVAVVDNDLLNTDDHGLSCGDVVKVEARQVMDVMPF